MSRKFDSLRDRYLARKAANEDLDAKFRSKYGSDWKLSWLSSSERRVLALTSKSLEKATDRFLEHLRAISPRDWSYGVPVYWVCAELTYDDAVRPTTEKLSVVPPLSYGAIAPRT